MDKIKYFFEQSWLLIVSSVCFGLLLAGLKTAWQPKIDANQQAKFNNLAVELLTDAKTFEPIKVITDLEVKKALNESGELVGWAFVCEGSGFSDKIRLVVAANATFDMIKGFGVLSSNETPGFGDKINVKPADGGFYQPQFMGVPADTLSLTKTGDPKVIDKDIVAISGATITSQAVVDILNGHVSTVKNKLKENGLLK